MKDEAMKQALEALRGGYGETRSWHKQIEAAITTLRTAIEAAEKQEPVATDWERIARVQDAKLRAMCNEPKAFEQLCEIMDRYEDLRPTPPAAQRQSARSAWVGLTDDEIRKLTKENIFVLNAIIATNAKLKEKNT
jgi:hypothetical protein